MGFYLSAVDDQLRHTSDAPSMGMILCKGKNEVVVEYALRDSARPMGVAEYRLSDALPETLRAELPTALEFAGELPLLSLAQLRMEIEREPRSILDARGIATDGRGILAMLDEFERLRSAPASTGRLRGALGVLGVLNRAAHGTDCQSAWK